MPSPNKILFVQVYAGGGIASEFLYRKPSDYRTHLLKTYPQMKKWAREEVFDEIREWPDDVAIQASVDDINVSGHFIAVNIKTPSKVLDSPINPEILISELRKDSYTHVGFSIISNDYSNFVKCARVVKDFDSSIITLAGGPGAMFEKTKDYVDHVCVGRGVPFLRKLFNEKIDDPYKLKIMSNLYHLKYLNLETSTILHRMVTKIGCPYKCDFCVTPNMYGGKYTGELFTPPYIHDELIKFRDKIGENKLSIYFEEPTSVVSLKWWYDLFDLFKEDDGDFAFYVYGVTSILEKLDLEKISNSAARFHLVNFGIESFNKNYSKNSNVNMKSLIRKFSDHGILTNPNYIIGFDFDNKESVMDDIKRLVDLGATMNTVLHLHPHPMTSVWKELESQNRLLDVPIEFHFIHGFQSFKHPNFKPGFEDMLPLLNKIYQYIQTETGGKIVTYIQVMKNLLNYTNHPKLFKKDIKNLISMGKMVYPKWKKFFNPSELQDKNYLSKIRL